MNLFFFKFKAHQQDFLISIDFLIFFSTAAFVWLTIKKYETDLKYRTISETYMKISQYQVSVIFCFSKIFGETKQTSKGQQQILLSPVLLSRSSSCRCVGAVSFHPTGSQASSNTLISPADPYKQRFTHRLGLCLLFLFFLLVLLDLLGDLGFGLSDQLPQRFAVGHRRHEGVLRRETNRASLKTCKGCWVTG